MKYTAQIGMFLSSMKKIVEARGFILVEREASLAFLAERGVSVDELKSVILGLGVADCFDGPEPDRDARYEGWTVAEFSPLMNGEKLYLKMSIKIAGNACKCLSVKLYVDR